MISSDGLFDNLYVEEIVELARKGDVETAGRQLKELAQQRMQTPKTDLPSHPDDLSFILFRPAK